MAPSSAVPEDSEAAREDAAARAAALDIHTSFLLQAPAGSGKTTVLTCRLLALLAAVDEPEEVLAITFTRKAAAQMRERVLRALQAAADGSASDAPEAVHAQAAWQRDRQRDWRLLASPARLKIMTIDAFCQALCAQLPIASRSGLRLEVAASARELYAAAARRLLEQALSGGPWLGPAQKLLARLDNDWGRCEELLIEMLAQRAHWLPRVLSGDGENLKLEERVAGSLRSLIAGRLTAVGHAVPRALLEEGGRLARHAARTLAHAGGTPDADALAWLAVSTPLSAQAEDLPRWRFLCALSMTGQGRWRQTWNRNQGLHPEHRAEKLALASWVAGLAALPDTEALFNDVLALPDALLPPEDAAALAALSQLLRLAAAELQLEFAAQGRVDFAAIAAAARAALTEQGQPTDLALRCGNAIRHILIDEFQDTSLEQFDLLQALTAGWEPGDGRTLFAVGDPMQSIYQFREAEVGLFLRARDSGIGSVQLQALRLRRNFRSAPALIEWVNDRIGGAFPARDDARLAAIRYLPALPARHDLEGAVTVHPLAAPDAAAEAAQIAALVAECRAQHPDATVAVLVGTREHAAPIVAALRARDLAVRGVRLEPLRERPAVRDLGALARALQHLGDRTAWLALLHAPHCGLTLAQLQALTEGSHASLWELISDAGRQGALDADARARLARVRAALTPALLGPERALPLWQRLSRAWLRLGGPAALEHDGELLEAQEFIMALAGEPHAERFAGDAFDAFAADSYASPSSGAGAVDVLTLHGAKGLEWDVVIVPGIGRAQRHDSEPLLHWLELPGGGGGSELLLSPIAPVGSRPERSLAQYISRLRKQRSRLERARVLYVAATRARRQLHWFGAAPRRADGELAPRADTMLGILWPMIGSSFRDLEAAEGAVPPAAAPVPAAPPPAWRLPADWAPERALAPVSAERLALSVRESAPEPEYSWVGLTARAVGTVVHAELQRLAQQAQLPLSHDAGSQEYEGWLAELGVPPGERAAAGGRIRAALDQTLRDPRGRWLLASGHREAHSEWRLTGLHEGRIANVIIDRLLIDERGERWLVDFKTSSHEGSDLDEFLAREEDRYRPQLQRYAALLTSATPGPVRAALYFPLLGAFREIALEQSAPGDS